MQTKTKRRIACLLAAVLAVVLILPATAADPLQEAADRAAAYVCRVQPDPQNGSIGGEWGVLAMARGEYTVPDGYYERYLANLETKVRQEQGVLSTNKYTEYSRVVLTLTALGKDPTQVAGYDLLAPLGSRSGTKNQGVNGSVWALIALDSGDYEVPKAASPDDQASREDYIDHILSRQDASGGWKVGRAPTVDPDMTAMALQALAKYQDQEKVRTAIDKGVACLASLQDDAGGFPSWGKISTESTAQVIIALCRLDISLEDSRFVKNGKTLLDLLYAEQKPDGSFRHAADGTGNEQMTTEQALLALTAALRAREGQSTLYDMTQSGHIQPEGRFVRTVTVVPEAPDLLKRLMAQSQVS